MSKFLVRRVETYRVDDENEAKQFIEDQKKANKYTLTRYASEHKERKAKGEIIDEWVKVTLTKDFNDEREPEIEYIVKDMEDED